MINHQYSIFDDILFTYLVESKTTNQMSLFRGPVHPDMSILTFDEALGERQLAVIGHEVLATNSRAIVFCDTVADVLAMQRVLVVSYILSHQNILFIFSLPGSTQSPSLNIASQHVN